MFYGKHDFERLFQIINLQAKQEKLLFENFFKLTKTSFMFLERVLTKSIMKQMQRKTHVLQIVTTG